MAKKKVVPLPTQEAKVEALRVISRTSEPLPAKKISTLLVAPFKISPTALVPILDEFVVSGQLHAFPPATAKGPPRYWDRDLTEYGRVLILGVLEKKGSQAQAKLKTAAKALDELQFKTTFQSLLDDRRVYEHPPLGKSRVVTYGLAPASPAAYLKEIGVQLAKIIHQLSAVGVSIDDLRDATDQLFLQAGLGQDSVDPQTVAPASQVNLELELLALIRQIEPGAEQGALVTARELRRAANQDKMIFDQAVLTLARKGQLMLHRHDYASGLSPSERDELVTDGAGTYYVGMALRRIIG